MSTVTDPRSVSGKRVRPIRLYLAIPALVLLAGYCFEVGQALQAPYFGWDVGAEKAIQAMPWGPIGGLFAILDRVEGLYQVGLAVLVVVFVFLVHRRATFMVVAGLSSAAVYYLTQAIVHRPRPDPHLVHVARHTSDFSFPSGHTVFFLCVAVLVTVAMRHSMVRKALALVISVVLFAVLAIAAIGRLYLGEHWPSDVLAGVLLGSGWSLAVLSVRWLTQK